MEAVQSILKEYEKVIDNLYKSDDWLKSKGFDSWDNVERKFKSRRIELEKEAYQLQKDLHKHLAINTY